jgi:hypothetical protein
MTQAFLAHKYRYIYKEQTQKTCPHPTILPIFVRNSPCAVHVTNFNQHPMKNLALALLLLLGPALRAQEAPTPPPERLLDFNLREDPARGLAFEPQMPPLQQVAGAPPAYWSYFWEFGDGSFSRAASPSHQYARPGDYTVWLDATAHYDDGKKAKKKWKKTGGSGTKVAGTAPPMPDVFDLKAQQAIAMATSSQPRAEEEISLVLSYRNLGALATDGRLHLFFNEKKYPSTHFRFGEARTHFGETADPLWSAAPPLGWVPFSGWAGLAQRRAGGASASLSGNYEQNIIIEEMLRTARGKYRDEQAWRFQQCLPGEKRNLFATLGGTTAMLADTNAFIHLEAVFAPFDPVVPPARFELEIEIVSSHDPNAIAVSDNRVNYRLLGSKKLDYKIQFQNNGKGPAKTVEVQVETPKGLQLGGMTPLQWYPECPICPPMPTNKSCLDTASRDGALTFTFRNIYLPGSNQEGVAQRDSTKGFVKYRLGAERQMPKRPFRSRARIVFDKNPPIYTNFTRTRFKVGLSPGLKAGYGFAPDAPREGYLFLGASLSPYKSWRWYPQLELLSGIKGRREQPLTRQPGTVLTQLNNGIPQLDSLFTDTLVNIRQGFVSFELPVLLRKNFSRFFGMGFGASATLLLESGETRSQRERTLINWNLQDTPAGVAAVRQAETQLLDDGTETSNFRRTRQQFAVFGDLSLGSVRAGPNLGARGGLLLAAKRSPQPFVQVSLEMKL